MLSSNDGALMIGDPAMLIDRSKLHIYDLAEEWRKHTGLPFVFAFWAVRTNSEAWFGAEASNAVDFIAAKREGLEHADELAGIYAKELGLAPDDLFRYLTQNISYDLDSDSLRGLALYYDLASQSGLIATPRPLEFL